MKPKKEKGAFINHMEKFSLMINKNNTKPYEDLLFAGHPFKCSPPNNLSKP